MHASVPYVDDQHALKGGEGTFSNLEFSYAEHTRKELFYPKVTNPEKALWCDNQENFELPKSSQLGAFKGARLSL